LLFKINRCLAAVVKDDLTDFQISLTGLLHVQAFYGTGVLARAFTWLWRTYGWQEMHRYKWFEVLFNNRNSVKVSRLHR
jgi:hypothetical protein